MYISRPVYHLAMVALVALVAQGCNKKNGIENETILKKPYSLYAGDAKGSLHLINSSDSGTVIFPNDGFASRALLTTGDSSILFAKQNLFLSSDNGKNFNLTYFRMNNFYLNVSPFIPWEQVMIKAAGHNRIYVASIEGKGIVYSEDNGKKWIVDNGWDPGTGSGNITSFAQLKNGTLFAHNLFDDSLYRRDNKDDNWTAVTPVQALPNSGVFYISHFNNELIATDITGGNGVYHSPDGASWFAYTGLPNRLLYTTASPFDQRLFVGTDSMGVYRLEGNNFVTANNGLETNTTVYAMVGKDDIYKNETKRAFIYMATNKGLYRSEDGGQNWTIYKVGSFVALY